MNTTTATFTNQVDAFRFARSHGGPVVVDVQHTARGKWLVTITAK